MALSDFVLVQISLTAQTLTRPGFGTPMLLAADCPAGFTQRVRTYTNVDDLVTDGFSTSGPTYLLASRLCQQDPRPPKFKVGRLALKPTQTFTITPTAVNSATYVMYVNGNTVSITADSSATAAEIVTALRSAIDALGLAITTSGTSTLIITANSAGAFFDVGVADLSLLSIVQDHVDPGVATDLAAIALEDGDWYCLLNAFNSKAMAIAIAGYAETNKRLFLFETIDSPAVTTVASGATDVVADQKSNTRYWTSAWYTPKTGDFLAAAVAGKLLPEDPGSEMWALKSVSGVAAAKLTTTQRTNVLAKNGNIYEPVANLSITNPGKVGAGEWIDVVRFRDWLAAEVQATVFDALRRDKKVSFTDTGISVVEGAIRSVLRRGVTVGGLSDSPAPKVIVPKAADVSSADKAARKLTGVYFDAVLAGAIVTVTPIKGVLTA